MPRNSRLQDFIPKIVLAPSFLIILVFVYGFIVYTGVLSLTNSRMLPSYGFVGLSNYTKLWALPYWWLTLINLAIFASLYIIFCSATRGGRAAPDLSLPDGAVLHRDGNGVEVVSRSGHRA